MKLITRRPLLAALVLLVAALLVAQALAGSGGGPRMAKTSVESPPQGQGPTAAGILPVTTYNLTQPSAYPIAITTDKSGNVWFSEDNFDSIVEYIPGNGTYRSFHIPTTSHLAWIWFLIFGPSGNLWFTDDSQSLLWMLNPSTGKFANFTAGGAFPLALTYDPAKDRIWFTSLKTDQVGFFQLSGGGARLTKLINFTAPGPGTGVAGIAVGPSGNVYVAESFQAKIIELSGSNYTTVKTWYLPAGSEPVGLALDEARERLWFTNHASSFFGYVDLGSSFYAEYPTSLLFSQGTYTVTLPYWIQISSSGDVWFNEHYNNKIARFDPTTMQLTEFDIPTNNSSPLRFHIDDQRGLVWFTEFEGNAIGVVAENSSLSARVGVSSPKLAFRSSGEVTATPYPQASPLQVSTNSSIAGNASPGFRVSIQASGNGYVVSYAGQKATPGNYSSAICFAYSGFNQCGFVMLTVKGFALGGELVYAMYASLVGGGVVMALVLFRELRRGRRRPDPR